MSTSVVHYAPHGPNNIMCRIYPSTKHHAMRARAQQNDRPHLLAERMQDVNCVLCQVAYSGRAATLTSAVLGFLGGSAIASIVLAIWVFLSRR